MTNLSEAPLRKILDQDEIQDIRDNKLLKLIEFNITNICQLDCPGCYKEGGSKNKQEIEFERYKKYIQMGLRHGLNEVWLLGGEPTLHKRWKDFLLYAEYEGVKEKTLFSNMLNLEPEDIRFLIENRIKLIGKLNVGKIEFLSEKEMDIQKRMIGSSETTAAKMLDQIKMILEEGLQDHKLFALENLLRLDNASYSLEFWKFCRDNGIIPNLEVFCDYTGSESSKIDTPSKEQVSKIIKDVHEYDVVRGFENCKPMVPHISHGCSLNYTGIAVDHDESILPCAASQHRITNFTEREPNYEEIMNDPIIQARRNLSRENIEGVCHNCETFDLGCYGGCRNAVEALSKNPYAGYENCVVKTN